jgi:ABC-type Mn2+/Zn2+ transport system permease subunit
MDWLIEPFEMAMHQRALIGGSLAAIALALVGTWVVIRGMTFLGDALAHGIIPGIGLAILLDFNLVLGALVAAAVMLFGIGLVHRQTAFSEDTSIGLLFVGMLSLGVILIAQTGSDEHDITEILFGEALGLTNGDIAMLAVLLVVVVIASAILYRPFLVLSFNEQKARLLGMNPRFAHAALLVLITIAIVGSFQTVGTLLVFGMLVGPPSAASLVVRRVPFIMLVACLIGVLSVFIGLVVSYHLDTPASATIALTPIVMFFLGLAAQSVRHRLRDRTVALGA